MKIYIDADGHPKMIQEILFRAAQRLKIPLSLISNQKKRLPDSPWISEIIVTQEPDAADHKIVEMVSEGDLVITSDIPLADRVIRKGAHVIGPRGEIYDCETIKQRLAMRNFAAQLREAGVQTKGPALYRPKDKLAFANALDHFLTRRLKKS